VLESLGGELNDGYTTTNIRFTAAMAYLFGDEALVKIETFEERNFRQSRFHLDIPSLDAGEYLKDFEAGNLAITDLQAYFRSFDFIVRCTKDMARKNASVWVSPEWIKGRGR
jgi:hypothetical protein